MTQEKPTKNTKSTEQVSDELRLMSKLFRDKAAAERIVQNKNNNYPLDTIHEAKTFLVQLEKSVLLTTRKIEDNVKVSEYINEIKQNYGDYEIGNFPNRITRGII